MPDEGETARHEQVVAIWKTVVEVQQHFNDISMRIRSMFVTILLALFASIGFMLNKKYDLPLGGVKIQFAVLIPLFGVIGTYLFYFIDRYWYHRLLNGAVKHGLEIEKMHQEKLPELALTTAIGAESPYEPKGVAYALARVIVEDASFKDTGRLHSSGKIQFFYKSVMLLLLFVAIVLSVLGGVSLNKGIAEPGGETTTEQVSKAKSPAGPATPTKEKGK